MSVQYAATTMEGLEFLPVLPAVSPIPVTIREKLVYSFDLSGWAPATGMVSSVTVRLEDDDGNTIANAPSYSLASNLATVTVNWTTAGLEPGREYLLWVTATLSDGETEEGYARFRVSKE